MGELRVPPHSVQAEQAVLGALMLDNAAIAEVGDALTAQDFYRHDHRLIFEGIRACDDASKPFDTVSLAEHLERIGTLDETGGVTYLAALVGSCPGAANVRHYADIVRDHAVLRRLIFAGNEIAQVAFQPEGLSTQEVIERAQATVLDVERPIGKGPRQVFSGFHGWLDNLDRRIESGGKPSGLLTGFTDIDEMTSGMNPGETWILAARSGMGKTTLAMNILENVAKQGHSTLFFSLEMPEEQLLSRLVANMSRLSSTALRRGRVDAEGLDRISAAAAVLQKLPLHIDDQSGLTLADIRARARRVKARNGLSLIAVDYLGLISARGENRENVVSTISRGLKALAKDLEVPVLALSQLNRQYSNRIDKRPMLSDLRDSGAIEQDADVIAFLHRESEYDKNTEFAYVAELEIAKQRNGPVGRVLLHYEGELSRFGNLDHMDKSNYRDWQRTKSLSHGGKAAKSYDFRD